MRVWTLLPRWSVIGFSHIHHSPWSPPFSTATLRLSEEAHILGKESGTQKDANKATLGNRPLFPFSCTTLRPNASLFPQQAYWKDHFNQKQMCMPGPVRGRKETRLATALTQALQELAPDTSRSVLPYLQDVPPDVVPQSPAQAMQDVQHLLLLQDTEETVQQDL